jgi:ABC-type uncharacterized transport system substrate-binding protein
MIVATGGTTSAQAASGETTTIPILVVSGSDPVQLAMEARARPGPRTVTGATVYHSQLAVKRVDLLRNWSRNRPSSPSSSIQTAS